MAQSVIKFYFQKVLKINEIFGLEVFICVFLLSKVGKFLKIFVLGYHCFSFITTVTRAYWGSL